MKRKYKIIGFLTFLLVGGGILIGAGKNSGTQQHFDIGKNLEIFFNLYKNINLLYVDTVNADKLMKEATVSMLSTLDPYTIYLSEDDMEEFKLTTTGKYGGVGSLISKPDSARYASIAGPYKGFPIDRAGIVIGDSIVAIDGRDLRTATAQEVSDLMKGDPGSSFRITIKKLRSGELETHTLKRETIKISPVLYSGILPGGIGYIAFTTFSKEGAAEVAAILQRMKKREKLNGLILDLRNNGGGIIDEAVDIVGLFTPTGTEVVQLKGRDKANNKTYRTVNHPADTLLPLAVLINNGSASASEIVAGALQDLDRAVIVGKRSFGKGLVQATYPVGFGSFVKMTTAKYYVPSGRCIQAVDYSHRNEDGSVGYVPDSLINRFTTKRGRIVYDGGGVMPDTVLNEDKLSLFTLSVYARRYIDDYATLYYKEHLEVPQIASFKLSDEEFDRFADYLKDKPIEFTSVSETNLDKLKQSAKREGTYDKIKTELEQIEEVLKERDKAESLRENREELRKLLAEEIISRYHYDTGQAEFSIKGDRIVETAAAILLDKPLYEEILTSRNTRKASTIAPEEGYEEEPYDGE